MAPKDIREEIDRIILNLVNSENPYPIEFFSFDQLTAMRVWLTILGYNLDPDKLGPKVMRQIREETQFRSITTGRGPAMEAILGKETLERLINLCDDSMQGESTKIVSNKTGEPIPGTEGRGAHQWAADLLFYVVTDDPKFIPNLNRRVWKWLRKSNAGNDEALRIIDTTFLAYEPPTKVLASVSQETVWAIWLFLTGRLV
ncbi:hypothetical protein HYS03_01915 [Candidatus Woesebacteria bacterium]|nr:hypothetical protein [Candidatus Woesebacteria bacterium]QQG47444.1 MAG: hypothetical protein HY044_04970 [Candidatus Woesebacteria bacterium]